MRQGFPQVARQLFGNFLYFEQRFSFRTTFSILSNFSCKLSSNSEISEQLLALKLAFLPYFTIFQQTIYEFPVKKGQIVPLGEDMGARQKQPGFLVRVFKRKFKMVDEDSHSTDLSFSGEEGHSTILLAHFMFWFHLRTKLFSYAGYAAKLHKKC